MFRARAFAALVVPASAAATLLVAGCTPKFDPASLVTNERLIAVVADPPEAVPGANVTLTPVVASPSGTLAEGEGFTAEWWRCPDDDSDALKRASRAFFGARRGAQLPSVLRVRGVASGLP